MRLKSMVQQYILSGSTLTAKLNVGLITPTGAQTTAVLPTYGTTVVIDSSLGDNFIIQVTNNTAFAVAAPTNPPASGFTKLITVTIANGSGGAHGAITWTAGAGGFRLAGALAAIANLNQRSIIFRWSGTVWNEIARTAADCLTA